MDFWRNEHSKEETHYKNTKFLTSFDIMGDVFRGYTRCPKLTCQFEKRIKKIEKRYIKNTVVFGETANFQSEKISELVANFCNR